MIISYPTTKIRKEEISPKEHGAALADEFYWRFNSNLDKNMTNEEAQECVVSFVIQLCENFNLHGYNLTMEDLITKIKKV